MNKAAHSPMIAQRRPDQRSGPVAIACQGSFAAQARPASTWRLAARSEVSLGAVDEPGHDMGGRPASHGEWRSPGLRQGLLALFRPFTHDTRELEHPVGAVGKHDVRPAGHPLLDGDTIPFDEYLGAAKGVDSGRLALGGDARADAKMGFGGLGTVERALSQDGFAAEDGLAGQPTAFAVLGLDGSHAAGDDLVLFRLGLASEGMGSGDIHGYKVGQRSIGAKKEFGPGGNHVAGGQGRLEGADAGPVLGGVNQIGCGGVGVGVDHLFDDVVRFDELDDRGRVGGPEVFEEEPSVRVPRCQEGEAVK